MTDDEVIGVFPLELVMLPGEPIPLHLFEPRYRQLYADCVLEQRPFAIVRRVADRAERVACAGVFETMIERFEDGRLNVVARGSVPCEILAPGDGDRLYDTALVRPLDDEPHDPDPELEGRAVEIFTRLASGNPLPEVPEGVPLSYRLAGAVDMPLDPKQRLLETRREDERLRQLVALLESAERGDEHAKVAAERAKRNGKVTPPER